MQNQLKNLPVEATLAEQGVGKIEKARRMITEIHQPSFKFHFKLNFYLHEFENRLCSIRGIKAKALKKGVLGTFGVVWKLRHFVHSIIIK